MLRVVQRRGWPMLSVDAVKTFFQVITFALTLMLVFKTNTCHSRWWEARTKIGLLTSTAHDMARAVSLVCVSHNSCTRISHDYVFYMQNKL